MLFSPFFEKFFLRFSFKPLPSNSLVIITLFLLLVNTKSKFLYKKESAAAPSFYYRINNSISVTLRLPEYYHPASTDSALLCRHIRILR